ncbi:hypothetical protein D7Z26_10375 [Cohnella endophytica]|uniref:Uncharacterized protein n=1 Tax=Cohnella endophytica TaxID=2419778 RepID=A0A494Y007_9BACL|nr:hypothetical protein [Cohnella endophytica]RKP55579.1 hypothetical protein D7Z26_10375 [Cohnella endophytica]
MKPDYHDMGMSITMGNELRKFVEDQLVKDLFYYYKFTGELRFDWSDSCVEGEDLNYLDGSLDRYSGIMIFNANDEPVADGLMDFEYLMKSDQLIIFWVYLDIIVDGKRIKAIEVEEDLLKHIKELIKECTESN